jgi:selenocysteine lyase/cysteine desulfurase
VNRIGGPLELTISLLESMPVEEVSEQMDFSGKVVRWTDSGRSGLALALEHWRDRLAGGWVLLPDYLCWDIILPVFQGITTRFAPIDEKFVVDQKVLERALSDNNLRAVFLVDYFGLCDLCPQINLIRSLRPDVLIIIDAVQAFSSMSIVTDRYAGADAVVSSPRKTLPIPDGGLVIVGKEEILPFPPIAENSAERVALYLSAGTLREALIKGRFDNSANSIVEPLYVDLFSRHGKLIGTKIEAISPLSMEILKRTDLRAIADKRSENLKWMQDSILEGRGGGLIRSALPTSMGPGLAFPVRVIAEHRNPLRSYLKEQGYFCPIHWPVPETMRASLGISSTLLSAELLSLPIDQRYDTLTLGLLLDAIEKYSKL